MRRTVTVTILAGALALLGAACGDGGGGGEISTPAGDVKVDEEGGDVSVETDEGSTSFGEDVPDDFPDEVPLPDGKVEGSFSSDVGGDKSWTVTYTDVDDITGYRDELEDDGYEITSELSGGSGDEKFTTFTAVSDDYSVAVLGGVDYVITVGPPDYAGATTGT